MQKLSRETITVRLALPIIIASELIISRGSRDPSEKGETKGKVVTRKEMKDK